MLPSWQRGTCGVQVGRVFPFSSLDFGGPVPPRHPRVLVSTIGHPHNHENRTHPENAAALARYAALAGRTPSRIHLTNTLRVTWCPLAMRDMAIFSAVIFLAISSLLLCSCSDVDQPPSRESHHSQIRAPRGKHKVWYGRRNRYVDDEEKEESGTRAKVSATPKPTPNPTPNGTDTDTSLERWMGPNFNNPR
jgi:hypothetical protein